MNKSLFLLLIFVCAVIGILDTAYLSYEHFAKIIPPCSTSIWVDCGKVLQSQYSIILGIPVAVLGLVHYVMLWLNTVGVTFFNFKQSKYLMVLQSWAAFFFSLYFVYLQLVVLRSICLYCMLSAFLSLVVVICVERIFFRERKQLAQWVMSVMYTTVLRRIFFMFDPEKVHVSMVSMGATVGTWSVSKAFVRWLLVIRKQPRLAQQLAGIEFRHPVGLAAGFDYEADLTQTLSAWGFGFQSVGTITNHAYEGNPRPMLGRLPKSQSLMVNKGFKNLGAEATLEKLKGLRFEIPVGVSIGRTNSKNPLSQSASVSDILNAFKHFEKAALPISYYELNISCPNLYGNVSFYPPKNLEQLLSAVDGLKLRKPLFIKMPIEKSDEEVLAMLKVIAKHYVKGVIFGNLQKNRQDPALVPEEVQKFDRGNFSGKPTFERSNHLIALTYKHYAKRLIIIGCGGVFSTEDAYIKIQLGASLIQLITGMIFQGPQLVSRINLELEEMLDRDGFNHLSEAVGSAFR